MSDVKPYTRAELDILPENPCLLTSEQYERLWATADLAASPPPAGRETDFRALMADILNADSPEQEAERWAEFDRAIAALAAAPPAGEREAAELADAWVAAQETLQADGNDGFRITDAERALATHVIRLVEIVRRQAGELTFQLKAKAAIVSDALAASTPADRRENVSEEKWFCEFCDAVVGATVDTCVPGDVTCENGHVIATFHSRALPADGERVTPEDA